MSAEAFALGRETDRLAALGRAQRDIAIGELRDAATGVLSRMAVLRTLPGTVGGLGIRREIDYLDSAIADARALITADDSPAAAMVAGWLDLVADLVERARAEITAAEQRAERATDERADRDRELDRELRSDAGWRRSWASCVSVELARYMADGDHRAATSYIAGLPGRGPGGARLRTLIGRESGDIPRLVGDGAPLPAAPDATTISESLEREAARVRDDPSVDREERRAWLAIRDGWWGRSGLGAESIGAHLAVLAARAPRPRRRAGQIGAR